MPDQPDAVVFLGEPAESVGKSPPISRNEGSKRHFLCFGAKKFILRDGYIVFGHIQYRRYEPSGSEKTGFISSFDHIAIRVQAIGLSPSFINLSKWDIVIAFSSRIGSSTGHVERLQNVFNNELPERPSRRSLDHLAQERKPITVVTIKCPWLAFRCMR